MTMRTMFKMMMTTASVVALSFTSACGDDDPVTQTDTLETDNGADTAVGDDTAIDEDTAVGVDTTVAEDTTVVEPTFDEVATLDRAKAFATEGFTRITTELIASAHAGDNVHIWVNNEAVDQYNALASDTPFPEGTIVVKEQLKASGDPSALTVMAKAFEGYAPAAGDWHWARIENDGEATFSGQVSFCIDCHTPQASKDWLFGVE